jgi:hypothetical protein
MKRRFCGILRTLKARCSLCPLSRLLTLPTMYRRLRNHFIATAVRSTVAHQRCDHLIARRPCRTYAKAPKLPVGSAFPCDRPQFHDGGTSFSGGSRKPRDEASTGFEHVANRFKDVLGAMDGSRRPRGGWYAQGVGGATSAVPLRQWWHGRGYED